MYDDLKYDDCPYCKEKELSTDYEGRCGNCHKHIGDDKYCRYCGTKKGEGKFEPYENFMPCVYGSPNTYIHKCRKCGVEFQSSGMSVPIPSYCYECGSKDVSEENWDEKSLECNIRLGSLSIHATNGHGGEETIFIYNTYSVKHETFFATKESNNAQKDELKIPESIKTIDELVKFIQKEKPSWCLNYYIPKSSIVSPQEPPKTVFGQSDVFKPEKNFMPCVYGSPTVQRNVQDDIFNPEKNFMPCVYGSPERMSGIYGNKKIKKQKKWMFYLLLALGVSVCIVLLILILLNL